MARLTVLGAVVAILAQCPQVQHITCSRRLSPCAAAGRRHTLAGAAHGVQVPCVAGDGEMGGERHSS